MLCVLAYLLDRVCGIVATAYTYMAIMPTQICIQIAHVHVHACTHTHTCACAHINLHSRFVNFGCQVLLEVELTCRRWERKLMQFEVGALALFISPLTVVKELWNDNLFCTL